MSRTEGWRRLPLLLDLARSSSVFWNRGSAWVTNRSSADGVSARAVNEIREASFIRSSSGLGKTPKATETSAPSTIGQETDGGATRIGTRPAGRRNIALSTRT